MNLAEIRKTASAYNLDVRSLHNEGVFLIDQKSWRFVKICDLGDISSIDNKTLVNIIRGFTNKLYGRDGERK